MIQPECISTHGEALGKQSIIMPCRYERDLILYINTPSRIIIMLYNDNHICIIDHTSNQWIFSNRKVSPQGATYSGNVRKSRSGRAKMRKAKISWTRYVWVFKPTEIRRVSCNSLCLNSVKETINCWKLEPWSRRLTHHLENVLFCPIRLCSSNCPLRLLQCHPRHTRVCTRHYLSRRYPHHALTS